MRPRKYYQHVQRDPDKIKSIWKVLHTVTFLIITFNSLLSAYLFGDILKMFNYRCILHGDPIFDVKEVIYLNETQSDNETQTNNVPEILNPPIFNSSGILVNIYNESIWYKNYSMYGRVDVRMRGSDYGSTTSCDLVLFVPLVSLIAAAAFGALIVLFGRGQVSSRSWFMVYPVLIASVIMVILYIIATTSMKHGLENFCSKFQNFTGHVACSEYMGYFSFRNKVNLQDFWSNYGICYYSYLAAIFLWMIQLAITILRLATMADFQFVTVSVEATEINSNDKHSEKIEKALNNSGLKPASDLFPSEEDVFVNGETVTSTNV